ncbi:MAG TPA: hypothetical protein GX734_02540 [Clostridiaceae bacterium]|nr:hypothetical protein [Clostridiaceae bacterium]
MFVELFNCPSCGSPLEINSADEFVKCKYCLSTIRIQRRNVNLDGSTTLTDKATGMVIGTVRLPFGYQAQGMLLPEISSYIYPFGVSASAYNDKGTVISYYIGEGYTDRSKCPALSGPNSQSLEQISRVHYKNFMDVLQYVHGYATMYANASKATNLRFVEEHQMPLYEPFNEAEALHNYKRRVDFEKQRIGNPGMAKDTGFYLKGLCCIYDMTVNSIDFRLAITTVLEGWKYQLPSMIGGLGGLGNLFDGLFSRGIAQDQKQQTGAFNDMPINSVIEWQSEGVFTMQCLPQEFELSFKGAYTDFCSTFRLDNGIREKMYNIQSQILQDIARHTQQTLDQMNRQFQTWQQIHATQQAAFDSYNRAWWNRTNASDAARRSAYHSKMAAENRMSDSYSEAVRGVNTYVRPDGTEVEVSVAYDRAYTNYFGDTLGSKSAFEPSGDWTEMNRK